MEGLTRMLTGSLGQFIDERVRVPAGPGPPAPPTTLYGKHGGPEQPGTLMGLLFHLLTGGDDAVQGFFGHVMGGIGAISDAIAAAGQAHGRGSAPGTRPGADPVAAGRAQESRWPAATS